MHSLQSGAWPDGFSVPCIPEVNGCLVIDKRLLTQMTASADIHEFQVENYLRREPTGYTTLELTLRLGPEITDAAREAVSAVQARDNDKPPTKKQKPGRAFDFDND